MTIQQKQIIEKYKQYKRACYCYDSVDRVEYMLRNPKSFDEKKVIEMCAKYNQECEDYMEREMNQE